MVASQVRRRPRRGQPTAVLVVAAALLGSGEPAFAVRSATGAPPQIVSVTTAPQAVVVSGPKKHNSPLTIRMRVSDPAGVDSVFAGIYAPQGAGRALRLKRVSGTARDGTWQARGGIPADGLPGSWRIQAFAVDTAQRSSDANEIYGNFAVRQATRFERFVVGPATAPAEVDLHATLQRWDGHDWVPAPLVPVAVQFRATDAAAYGTVETVRSGSDGTVAATEHTGIANGSWRLSYAGDDTTAAVDSSDGVLPAPTPSPSPTAQPTSTVTPAPSATPRAVPSAGPTGAPTGGPTAGPTARPKAHPTARPTAGPTARPTAGPTTRPTQYPTGAESPVATAGPAPSVSPRRAGRARRR